MHNSDLLERKGTRSTWNRLSINPPPTKRKTLQLEFMWHVNNANTLVRVPVQIGIALVTWYELSGNYHWVCIIFISTNSKYVSFSMCNIKVVHHQHQSFFLHITNISYHTYRCVCDLLNLHAINDVKQNKNTYSWVYSLMLRKSFGRVWAGFIWLRKGTSYRFLGNQLHQYRVENPTISCCLHCQNWCDEWTWPICIFIMSAS